MSITAKIKSNDNITARIKSAERIVTTSAHYGLKGDTGATGPTGAQGIQGNTGPTGAQGIQGIQGVKGDTGSQGIQGIQGANGGSSSHYHYLTKTNTLSGDPTSTFIGWNNATQIDSTALRISNTDQDSQDNNIFLNSVNVGDILVIQDRNNAANFQKWEVTGTPTFNSTWDNFPVTRLTTGGTGTTNFANNYAVLLIIISVGAVGPQGIQGATGATGATGAQGIQGIQGVTGAAGATGPGVAAGGATGTVLTKVSATNYDTTWTALGTAATRNVGQAAGNVPELSAAGEITLGSGLVNGKLRFWDPDEEDYAKLYVSGNDIKLENPSGGLLTFALNNFGVEFNFSGNTDYKSYDFPNTSGYIALTTDITATNLTGTVPVSKGGTGRTTATAYAPLFGGTTTTGAFQSGTVGTAGQVLTSNGDSQLPTFQAAAGGSISTITGLGTGVATALANNIGSAGAPLVNGGVLGTPSSGVGTNLTALNASNLSTGTVAAARMTAATTTTAGTVPGIGTSDTALTNALTVADFALVPPIIMAWERVTAAVTGSGTSEGNSGIYYGVGTGVTASSTSRVDCNTSLGDPWYYGYYNSGAFSATDRFIINGVFLRISSTSTGVWRFGIGKTYTGAVGQWTEAGFGFACKNSRLWSFTHNGTTYTENDTGVDIPSGEVPMQFCILRTSTAHLFYLNRTLVATHTATGYANGRFIRIEAENGANAAAQRMRIAPITLRFL